jgi:cysteine desulfurase
MSVGLYFDSAATTPLSHEAWKEMESVREIWGNSNSRHAEGFRARKKIDEYLQRIADCLHVARDQLVITHGGTDANRKVLWSMRKRIGHENMWCSTQEHSSVADEILEDHRFCARTFESIPKNPKFLALMQANNETGEIFDTMDLRKKYPDAIILSDWVQGVGKIPFDVSAVDFATISAHKFYGPKGVGILYVRNPEEYRDLSKDTHTKDLGTLSGMAKALEELNKSNHTSFLQDQTNIIETFFKKHIAHFHIHAQDKKRVPGIINVAFKDIRGSELMTKLSEEEGICVSTGSACASDMLAPSRIIQCIEKNSHYHYPLRIGLHSYLTEKNISYFCEVLAHCVAELRLSS